MPSEAAKAKRMAQRAAQNSQQGQYSTEPNSNTTDPPTVDGKQVETADPQVQHTANRHGKQPERGNQSAPQETTQLVSRTGKLATRIMQPMHTRQHHSAPYRTTLPGAKAFVETFGTKYSIGARGLSTMQIRRACEKAYMETFTQMKIVPDAQYEAEFIELFQTTLEQRAARILESKRRRCARTHRKPTSEV